MYSFFTIGEGHTNILDVLTNSLNIVMALRVTHLLEAIPCHSKLANGLVVHAIEVWESIKWSGWCEVVGVELIGPHFYNGLADIVRRRFRLSQMS